MEVGIFAILVSLSFRTFIKLKRKTIYFFSYLIATWKPIIMFLTQRKRNDWPRYDKFQSKEGCMQALLRPEFRQ